MRHRRSRARLVWLRCVKSTAAMIVCCTARQAKQRIGRYEAEGFVVTVEG